MAALLVLFCSISILSVTDGGKVKEAEDAPFRFMPETSHRHGHEHLSKRVKVSSRSVYERKTNMMRSARDFILDHPEIIPSVYDMLRTIETEWLLADYGSDLDSLDCPFYGEYPCEVTPTASSNAVVEETENRLTDAWRHLLAILEDDSNECKSCSVFWTALKELACSGVDWPTVRDIIIQWCSDNLPLLPSVCNGTITIQGKHVYCIILQADPRHFCESMNNCFPPDDREDRPPVGDRTPWAVKDQLARQGDWPRQERRPGVRRKPESDKYVTIAALTDVHVQMNHAVGAPVECEAGVCCLEEYPGDGSARYWGEYTCNLPFHTLKLFLERVHGIQPDFLIFAGDIPPHTMWDETEGSQLNCSQLIVEAMTETFGPDLRVYPVIGNHEMYPTNLYSMHIGETQRMTKQFAAIWSKPAGFDPITNATFSNMSYYTLLVPGHDRLRIVAINTELDWYTMNFYATLNEPTAANKEHKQWLNDTLRKARENNEKVIIISHHPVGGGDGNVRSARWWEMLVNEYHDVITLHVSGHTHIDELKLIFDPLTMEAVGVNHIAPSANTKTYINPSLVMYYLDPINYSLVDYESFHLEIKDQEQSIGVPPAIVFGYSSRKEYDMPDLSPESYKDLVLRFTEDDDLFQKYRQNRNSQSAPGEVCDYACRVTEICNIWFPENDEAQECTLHAPPPETTTSPDTTTGYVDRANAMAQDALVTWALWLAVLWFR